MRHILAAQKYQQVTSYHRHQWTSQAFLKIDVKVVGLLDAQLIRDIYFKKKGNHQDSLRDAEAAIKLNPTFLKAIVRG